MPQSMSLKRVRRHEENIRDLNPDDPGALGQEGIWLELEDSFPGVGLEDKVVLFGENM